MQNVQQEIDKWASQTIPDRDLIGCLQKLSFEELPELIQAVLHKEDDVRGELADCLILVLDAATLLGVDAEKAVMDKLRQNYNRKWKQNPDTGFFNHV